MDLETFLLLCIISLIIWCGNVSYVTIEVRRQSCSKRSNLKPEIDR